MNGTGKLLIIGFGPGSYEHITERARSAIEESDVIIGYNTYVDLVRGLLTDQEIVRTGMTEEVSRAREAVRQANAGKKVAVISSGDAGVYGMAGLVYEVLIEQGWKPSSGVEVEVIPGISAIQSCASLLGAPVMHDACTISLSDHLTPWEMIAKRVEAAASADFIIALYNPRSGRRTRQIVETQRIVLKYRSPETPVGLVKSAYRDRQHVVLTTLGDMLEHDIGMLTTVIIGNSTTAVYEGLMVTPRGYQRKYTLGSDEQPLKPHERLRTEAEPWSLDAQSPAEQVVEPESETEQAELIAVSAQVEMEAKTEQVELAAFPARAALASATPLVLANEALERLYGREAAPSSTAAAAAPLRQPAIFEVGISPGVAGKKFTAKQMMLLAGLAGDGGELEYSTQHQIVLRVPTSEPDRVVASLKNEGLLVFPLGDVALVKACDFCNLEKTDAIPVAETLNNVFGGRSMPKEMKVGVNGCGMACYGAVMEDIGIVYRKGGYDLFLGGKQIGRNAHAGQLAAEGLDAETLVRTVERILQEFKEKGHPGERFHKFFRRVGQVGGYTHKEYVAPVAVDAVCGD